jgi:hypothetical protein
MTRTSAPKVKLLKLVGSAQNSRAIAQLSTNQACYGQQKIEALEHYIKQKPNNLPKLTRIVVILSVLGWGDNG